jgi:hypothetical protein
MRTFSLLLALALPPATHAFGVIDASDGPEFASERGHVRQVRRPSCASERGQFAVLRALDDAQLMAELTRRNLNRAPRCS